MSEPEVRRNDGAGRYEIEVEGELAGYAEFQLRDGGITFSHTVVDDAYEGRGIGSRLAKAVLEDAKAQGLRVTQRCSFIKSYIDRHPEYLDLVSS